MNNGYLFLIICWMLIMLTLTQWLDFLWMRAGHTLEQQRKKALVLILLVISLQGFYIPLSPYAAINVAIILVGGFFVYFLWKDQAGYRLQILAVILFLAFFYAVAYELFVLDPIIMIIPPLWLLPAFLSIFVAFTTKELGAQWLMITGGLIFGEAMHKAFLLSRVHFVYVWDAAFRDQFIVSLVLMTLLHYLIILGHKMGQFMLRPFRIKQPDGKQEG